MVVLVMGVAGSGKTLIGTALAKSLGWRFADADSFHSVQNVRKMSQGIPLTDADRAPWLHALRDAIRDWNSRAENVVLACSALKQCYRDELSMGNDLKIVYLKGGFDLIHSRISGRRDHYMKPEMLASQFADLEEPADAFVADVARSPDEIVAEIRRKLFAPNET